AAAVPGHLLQEGAARVGAVLLRDARRARRPGRAAEAGPGEPGAVPPVIALFVQALLLDLGRVGAPVPEEVVARAYEAACEAGAEAACERPGAAHAQTCDDGDA